MLTDLHVFVASLLRGTMELRAVRGTAVAIAEAVLADIVFGVWIDPDQPLGIAFYAIKGEELMDAIYEHGWDHIQPTVAAIPCAGPEEAAAMRERLEVSETNGN